MGPTALSDPAGHRARTVRCYPACPAPLLGRDWLSRRHFHSTVKMNQEAAPSDGSPWTCIIVRYPGRLGGLAGARAPTADGDDPQNPGRTVRMTADRRARNVTPNLAVTPAI